MRRRDFLTTVAIGGAMGVIGTPVTSAASTTSVAQKQQLEKADDHSYFAALLKKIAEPILDLMARERFHRDFPLEINPKGDGRDKRVAYLECFGRTIAGAAPWLALDTPGTDEGDRRNMRENALLAYEHSVDPSSADYLDWKIGHGQLLVDSAYYTQALLRAPILWEQQSKLTKNRIVAAIKSLRAVNPPYTNWLLFAAMNEAFLM